jgi:hypothetical protein
MQGLVQICSRRGRGIVENMCYDRDTTSRGLGGMALVERGLGKRTGRDRESGWRGGILKHDLQVESLGVGGGKNRCEGRRHALQGVDVLV